MALHACMDRVDRGRSVALERIVGRLFVLISVMFVSCHECYGKVIEQRFERGVLCEEMANDLCRSFYFLIFAMNVKCLGLSERKKTRCSAGSHCSFNTRTNKRPNNLKDSQQKDQYSCGYNGCQGYRPCVFLGCNMKTQAPCFCTVCKTTFRGLDVSESHGD